MKKLCGVVVVSIVLIGSTAAPAAAAASGAPHTPTRNALCKVFPRLCL
jgi:hypothetical protein